MVGHDVVDFILKVLEISKIGLKYSQDPYARDNYSQLQKLAESFLSDKEHIKFSSTDFFTRDIYPTPSISVRGVILDATRSKVLLVKEKSDHGWSLPGGWAELGLSPSESILKELREEAGVECRLVSLLGLLDRYENQTTTGVPEYIAFFLAEPCSEFHEPCFEIEDRAYFPLDSLPPWSKKNDPEEMKKILSAAVENKTIFD